MSENIIKFPKKNKKDLLNKVEKAILIHEKDKKNTIILDNIIYFIGGILVGLMFSIMFMQFNKIL